jgi:hypothetical protein
VTLSIRVLRPGDVDHEQLWSAVGALAAGAAWAMLRVHGPLFPATCVFKAVTGVPCLTCGGTRAVEALAAGRFLEALWLNPMVTAVAAGWAAYAAYGIGAMARAWPRVAVRMDAQECTVLRVIAGAAVLAGWVFLVAEGR